MIQLSNLAARAYQWFGQRLALADMRDFLVKKSVPQHRHSFWYFFGGLTLFFLIMQVITGILLSLYYKPVTDQAHESIEFIIAHVGYGWLIRSLHSWSSNLMIGSLFIHMFSAFLMKGYRKPRELLWLTGVLLMFLIFGFGFTGYLLPWDTTAYFATLIGTEVPRVMPIIGNWGVGLLKGGADVGPETLTRMYSIHVIILPLATLVTVCLHILLSQIQGSSVPVSVRAKERGPSVPFFPNFLYRDLIAWSIGFVGLLALATMLPRGIGEKADTLASAPVGIKPEWYFLPLYQTLKFVPSSVFGLNGELIVNCLVSLVSMFWFAIPFIDRKSRQEQKSSVFTALGILLILYLTMTIVLAYAGP